MRFSSRFALIAPLFAALLAGGCGGKDPSASPAQPGTAGTTDPAAASAGEPVTATAEAPNAGPLPEVPAAGAPLSMRLAGSDATYGYMIFPSLQGAADQVKAIAELIDENADVDGAEAGMLQMLDLSPGALDAIERDKPTVLVILEPDMEKGEPLVVAVLPVVSAEAFRAALTVAPAPPAGLPPGVDPKEFAKPGLSEQEAEPGIFTYSKKTKEFDWDAYETAQKKAMDAGGEMPEMDAFQIEREKVVYALTAKEGHVLVSNTVAAVKQLRDAKQAETVPAVPAGDAAIFVSAGKLRQKFAKELEEGLTTMRRGMKDVANEASPLPGMGDLFGNMGDGMEAVVRQAQGVHLNIALGKPALRLAMGATFDKGGSVAAALRTQLHDGPDLVRLLPAGSRLVSSSRIRPTDEYRKWNDDLTRDLFKSFKDEAKLPDDPEIHKLIERFEKLVPRLNTAFTGEAAAGLTLSAERGLTLVEIVRVGKAGEAKALAIEGVEIIKAVIAKAKSELKKEGEEVPVDVTIDHVEGAVEHRGVKINMVSLSVALPNEMPGVDMVRSVMQSLLGSPDTVGVYYAETQQTLVFAVGGAAEERVKRILDLMADGQTEGPGGDFDKIAAGMPKRPTIFVYVAPLQLADAGIEIAARTQAVGCLAHQKTCNAGAQKFKTLNGAFPDSVWQLKEQDLIAWGGDAGCEAQYQIDPNSGAVRCGVHGSAAAPVKPTDAAKALGFEWTKPEGNASFAYYGNVFDRPEGVGAEFGVVSTTETFQNMTKALQPIIDALGGGGRRSRIGTNESAAIGSLRSLVSAQEQFKMQAVVDQDEDGMGEYGTLGELAGIDSLRGSDTKLDNSPFIASILGIKESSGLAQKSGYYYRVFLAGAEGPITEGLGALAKGSQGDADAQETRWCAYAWPIASGVSGNRAFFVNQAGEVYASAARRTPYTGTEAQPKADAAFEKAQGANLDAGVGLAAAGLQSNDGNAWVPAGF